MIKRIVWLTIGVGVGVYAVLRAQASMRRRTDRLKPERMASDLTQAVRDFAVDLRKAVEEGRTAMRTREAQLQEALAAKTGEP